MDELKQKVSDVTGNDSGSKVELIARISDTLLENAATKVCVRAGLKSAE